MRVKTVTHWGYEAYDYIAKAFAPLCIQPILVLATSGKMCELYVT